MEDLYSIIKEIGKVAYDRGFKDGLYSNKKEAENLENVNNYNPPLSPTVKLLSKIENAVKDTKQGRLERD